MLRNLWLKFGPAPGQPKLKVPVGSAVILVGPNNSGKSRLLQEIERKLKQKDKDGTSFLFKESERKDQDYHVLRGIGYEVPGNRPLQRALTAQIKDDLPKEIFGSNGAFTDLKSSMDTLGSKGFSKIAKMLKEEKLVLGEHHELIIKQLKQGIGELGVILDLLSLENRSRETSDSNESPAGQEDPEKVKAQQAFEGAVDAGIRLFGELRDAARRGKLEGTILKVLRDGRLRVAPYGALLGPFTIRLDGRQRLAHVSPTGLPHRGSSGDNILTKFFKNEPARQLLREIVHDAFDQYLCFDVSGFDKTVLKLSAEHPGEYELMPLKPEAIAFLEKAREVENFSDGVKSFIGLLCSVLCDEYVVMLIDEPEAFLHPPLARKLGQRLHELALKRKAHVVAATHSADFLMGCIQAGPDVNIVRLTYRKEVPTARLLPLEDLKQMMHDPLLRSTGMLSALFHDGAIVCEGDSDRAFYQEINERLCAQKKKEGVDGCLFINAHSKQAIHRVVGPLRKMGVPAVAIVDLDILIDDDVLKELLAAVGADPALINTLGMAKGQVHQAFITEAKKEGGEEKAVKARAKGLLKSKGINALDDKQRRTAKTLFFDPLAQQGIFIVPVGEVEGWLARVLAGGPPPHKGNWLNTIFQAIGTNPQAPGYVHAEKDDVWAFMRDITQWINDPNRQGLPSS